MKNCRRNWIAEGHHAFFSVQDRKGRHRQGVSEADQVLEETFTTGHQEHVHLETNAMIGEWTDGKVTVRGSLQCPYYVFRAVRKALGCADSDLNVVQEATGGAFGGKEGLSQHSGLPGGGGRGQGEKAGQAGVLPAGGHRLHAQAPSVGLYL